MSENFEDLGDLGEKIKDIIDRAVSTKDYSQMTEDISETVGETVNRAVNSAVDSGGEAIQNELNSVFGKGNAQSGDHEKYQKAMAASHQNQAIPIIADLIDQLASH